jgi:hypothetical protein
MVVEAAMKLLAITTDHVSQSCEIKSLEITVLLDYYNRELVFCKGSFSTPPQQSGFLHWYFWGNLVQSKEQQRSGIRIDTIEKEFSNHSILSIPYSDSRNGVHEFSFTVELEMLNPPRVNDPLLSFYYGEESISKELLAQKVWERLVLIQILSAYLLHPYYLPTAYIRPTPVQLSKGTIRNTMQTLSQELDIDLFNIGLLNWFQRDIHRITPFAIGYPSIEELRAEFIEEKHGKQEKSLDDGCRLALSHFFDWFKGKKRRSRK